MPCDDIFLKIQIITHLLFRHMYCWLTHLTALVFVITYPSYCGVTTWPRCHLSLWCYKYLTQIILICSDAVVSRGCVAGRTLVHQ